jgi:hypothetical protein
MEIRCHIIHESGRVPRQMIRTPSSQKPCRPHLLSISGDYTMQGVLHMAAVWVICCRTATEMALRNKHIARQCAYTGVCAAQITHPLRS